MTREEAKEELDFCELVVSENIVCGTYEGYPCCVIDVLLKKIFDEHEAQLKAKENHIVELNKMVMEKNEIIDVLHISSSGFNDLYYDYRKLSRKICAMLFWEWRKANDFDIRNTFYFAFKKAYAMIKDNK